jgi:hypothetical protein
MSEKQKLLKLINSIDSKDVGHVEFTPAEYSKLVNELRPLGAKVKLTVIPQKNKRKKN